MQPTLKILAVLGDVCPMIGTVLIGVVGNPTGGLVVGTKVKGKFMGLGVEIDALKVDGGLVIRKLGLVVEIGAFELFNWIVDGGFPVVVVIIPLEAGPVVDFGVVIWAVVGINFAVVDGRNDSALKVVICVVIGTLVVEIWP